MTLAEDYREVLEVAGETIQRHGGWRVGLDLEPEFHRLDEGPAALDLRPSGFVCHSGLIIGPNQIPL